MLPTSLEPEVILEPIQDENLQQSQDENESSYKISEEEIQSKQEELLSEEDYEQDNIFLNRIDSLSERGLLGISELPDEFKTAEWNQDTYDKFIEFILVQNKEKEKEIADSASSSTFQSVLENMSDITRKGFEFEITHKEPDEIQDFYKQLVFEAEIKNLNPADSYDATKILTQYYQDLGENLEDIKEKIEDLTTLNKLTKEAAKIKPLLDKKVEEIAKNKLDQQNAILQFEAEQKKGLSVKLNEIYKDNNVDGIPLTPEIKDFLNRILIEDEVEVEIKGKKVNIGVAEYLVMHHKYSKNGNLKSLIKGLLQIQAPELIEEYYQKKVTTKETERFIKEHKLSSQVKSGVVPDKPQPKNNRILLRS